MKVLFERTVNFNMIGKAVGIPADAARELFSDGRMLGRLAEFQVANELKGKRTHEHSAFDVLHAKKRIEVRSLIKKDDRGMSFAPAKETGSGRTITEHGFQEKLDSLDFFIAAELLDTDKIRYFQITKEDIDMFELNGYIRPATKTIGYNTFYKVYNTYVLSSKADQKITT
jgi:hypothetical protein